LLGLSSGKSFVMQIRKLIQRRIRHSANGVHFVGDVNAAISANVGERSSTNRVSSRSSVSTKSVQQNEGGPGGEAEQGRPDA
jgi:hypothetical protein